MVSHMTELVYQHLKETMYDDVVPFRYSSLFSSSVQLVGTRQQIKGMNQYDMCSAFLGKILSKQFN